MKDFTYFFNGDTNLLGAIVAKKFQRKKFIKEVGWNFYKCNVRRLSTNDLEKRNNNISMSKSQISKS